MTVFIDFIYSPLNSAILSCSSEVTINKSMGRHRKHFPKFSCLKMPSKHSIYGSLGEFFFFVPPGCFGKTRFADILSCYFGNKNNHQLSDYNILRSECFNPHCTEVGRAPLIIFDFAFY